MSKSPEETVDLQGSLPATALRTDLRVGDTVGRYVVLGRLGEGGMGVVYSAFDPQLDRKVALKLLHAGPEERESAAQSRLLREAQAMARLSHPNVATVHDVGVIGDRVFVAMELVHGQNLRAWLKAEARPWRQVLGVLVQAGRGLAAAHAANLVHRDVKPDNILISEGGLAKITDFGLARAADDKAPPAAAQLPVPSQGLLLTPLTQAGHVTGTPVYMAPESHRGVAPDARADQFSFCVTAYEALYGQRPLTVEDTQKMVKGERVATRPPPPGVRVPRWVYRALLKGLSTDPALRHRGMDALVDELSRDPAAARRRWAGATLLLAVAGAGVGAWRWADTRQGRLCAGGAEHLAGVWDAPRRQAVHDAFLAASKDYGEDAFRSAAGAVDDFVRRWVEMRNLACAATRIHGEQSEAVLTARNACLDRQLQSLQALGEIWQHAPAAVVAKAPRAAAALSDLAECADVEALLAQVKPPADPVTRARVQALGAEIARADAQRESGQYAEGLKTAQAASAEAHPLGYPPVLAQSLTALGRLQVLTQDAKGAADSFTEAELAAESSRADTLAAEVAARRVAALVRLAHYPDAKAEDQHARALLARAGRPPRVETEVVRSETQMALEEGRYSDALERAAELVQLSERTFGKDDIHVATALKLLGYVSARGGREKDAVVAAQRALEITQRKLGPLHPETAEGYAALGDAELQAGQHAAAHRDLAHVVEIDEKLFGKDSPIVTSSRDALAGCLQEEARFREALALFESVGAAYAKALGPDNPSTVGATLNRALCLESLGQAEGALALYAGAAQQIQRVSGPNNPMLFFEESLAGDAAHDLGRLDEALAHYKRAMAVAETQGKDWTPTANAMAFMALVLADQGKLKEAHALAQRGWELSQKTLGVDNLRTIDEASCLAEIQLAEGNDAEAAASAGKALAVSESSTAPFHYRVLGARRRLGLARLGLGDVAGALEQLERGAKDAADPETSPWDRARIRFALAQALWAEGTDRPRARAVAGQAREELARIHGAFFLRQVDAWLAKH